MKLALKCVVSLRRPKSEGNLTLTIFHSFCCSKSLVAIISSIWPHCLLKIQNAKTPNTEGPTHRRVKTPKNHDTSYKSLRQNSRSYCRLVMSYWNIISLLSCHVILIYHIALIHHIILIYFVLISYSLITIVHLPGIISHYADIMSSWYILWYHII